MSILDRSFLTPEDAGFDYTPHFEALAIGTATATGQIVQYFKASPVGQGVASGGVYTILEADVSGVATGTSTLYPALQSSASGQAFADGNIDDDVFRATVLGSATAEVLSVATIQDIQASAVATATTTGSLIEIWSAQGSGSGFASGGLYEPLMASGVASSTATGTIVLAFRASAIGSGFVDGNGIDQPDFIQGDAIGSSVASGGLYTGFSVMASGVGSATGSSILTQAADLAARPVGSGIADVGEVFLAVGSDLAGYSLGIGSGTGIVLAPVRRLQKLQKIRLVHSINRTAR